MYLTLNQKMMDKSNLDRAHVTIRGLSDTIILILWNKKHDMVETVIARKGSGGRAVIMETPVFFPEPRMGDIVSISQNLEYHEPWVYEAGDILERSTMEIAILWVKDWHDTEQMFADSIFMEFVAMRHFTNDTMRLNFLKNYFGGAETGEIVVISFDSHYTLPINSLLATRRDLVLGGTRLERKFS